ncbi:hypothetical protein DFH08DRAFT_309300 [Mycena albidolilacea]|uniref:Uncharacterized protein n=1 Tax=Mycena albidolilacea TaxID=1033008 RepID=A0AAD6ZP36_9AGAR|nr:hypothetical protein DFH08DRAFT_309300 [Mycena albidolilacea]
MLIPRDESEKSSYSPVRRVVLPQARLRRIMVIASTDNARDLEDGGLLLGREDVTDGDAAPSTAKARYVVETLLIPTQHAPRNTCTADEENDMLRFTEERGFITLGWAVFRLLAYACELPPHGRSECVLLLHSCLYSSRFFHLFPHSRPRCSCASRPASCPSYALVSLFPEPQYIRLTDP